MSCEAGAEATGTPLAALYPESFPTPGLLAQNRFGVSRGRRFEGQTNIQLRRRRQYHERASNQPLGVGR